MSWTTRTRLNRLKTSALCALATVGLCLSEVMAQESFTVVTDIDDTLRVSNVNDQTNRLVRFVFSNRSFSGMPELFQSWRERGSISDFVYLSAAPELVRPRVELYLDHQRFPIGRVILKRTSDSEDFGDYKVARLEELVTQSAGRLILVGDDTQADPRAYLEIFLRYPDRIAEIYIRKVSHGDVLPWPIRPFLTTYDVARSEYVLERLSLDQLKKIADRIISDPRKSRVLPPFQKCPSPVWLRATDEIAELDRRIEARIRAICESRTLTQEEES